MRPIKVVAAFSRLPRHASQAHPSSQPIVAGIVMPIYCPALPSQSQEINKDDPSRMSMRSCKPRPKGAKVPKPSMLKQFAKRSSCEEICLVE